MPDGAVRATNHSLGKPQEACGVVGIWGKDTSVPAASLCYLGLYALQHRGQESAGIVTFDGNKMWLGKGPGLVPEVFDQIL